MATIKKRTSKQGKHTYQAQIIRKGYPSQYRTFNLKSDAEKWARKIEREMDTDHFVDLSKAERLTLGEALDEYLEKKSINKKGKGYSTDKSRVNVIKRHSIHKLSFAKVKSHHIASYRDDRLKSARPNTVRLELAIISNLYTIANSEWKDMNVDNPVIKGVWPKNIKDYDRTRRLNSKENEEERLFEAAEKSIWWLKPVIILAIETAMRRGEIASLTWDKIQLKERLIILEKEKTKNKSERIIPLSKKAVQCLKEIKRNSKNTDARVFKILPDQISKQFNASAESAKINDFHFHDLRREACSRLSKEFNILELMKITGHKTMQQVLTYYNDDVSTYVSRMDKVSLGNRQVLRK
ncbi:MAG: site-specific integrase [Gammaproteobacteria bacterium]